MMSGLSRNAVLRSFLSHSTLICYPYINLYRRSVAVSHLPRLNLYSLLQGAQAGSILAADAAEASIASDAAAAASTATELIPLVLLRQTKKPVRAQTKQQKLQQRVLNAPYRLAGYSVADYNPSAPSADPWSG